MPRRCRLTLVLLAVFVSLVSLRDTRAQAPNIAWTDIVNATVIGTVLQKTAGWDGVDDAGARSVQALDAGDGYVEFTVGEADTFWIGGMSHDTDGTRYADIDFAFRFNGAGSADVLENGVYAGGDTPYAAGDVFRVEVKGGRVQYFRNGQFLRESARLPAYPLFLDVSLGSVGASVRDAVLGVASPPPPGGGFIETAGSPALRPRFTRAQIAAFLPPNGAKGAFQFPAPYNTVGVRLTNASDCVGGQDCLWYAGYSYWRNMNYHVGSADMYIFLSTDRNYGGVGPVLIRYNKVTDAVQNHGPLFPASSPYSHSSGEGWYFSGTQSRTPLRLSRRNGAAAPLRHPATAASRRLRHLTLLRAHDRTSVPPRRRSSSQPHSSDDDLVHSATVQNASWGRIGCVVYRSSARKFRYFATPSGYLLDECHVDKSGNWLMLLETRPNGSRRNRVVNLRRGTIASIEDVDGALGHLDMGFGYAVGADTFNPLPNATILLRFPVTTVTRPIGPVVHFNKRWDIAAANHVAHGNARPSIGPAAQYACGSNAGRVTDMADEIVCFRLSSYGPDGSLDVLVVAQVMTDLDAAGGRDFDGDDYEQLPKGNVDVTGRYFLWTTNFRGNRLDAFLVKIPAERFDGTQSGSLSANAPAPKQPGCGCAKMRPTCSCSPGP